MLFSTCLTPTRSVRFFRSYVECIVAYTSAPSYQILPTLALVGEHFLDDRVHFLRVTCWVANAADKEQIDGGGAEEDQVKSYYTSGIRTSTRRTSETVSTYYKKAGNP